MELEFIGDWPPDAAQAIAATLQKSLGTDAGGGAESTLQQLEDNPIQQMLSKRQKRLLELLQEAGAKTFATPLAKTLWTEDHECGPDCNHQWDYGLNDLSKAVQGAIKHDAQGRTYQLNSHNRWQRYSVGDVPQPTGNFRFTTEPGIYGRGIYLPILESPQGYARLRVRLNLSPAELISDDQFYELEDNFAEDLSLALDRQGVRGIVQTNGDAVSLLCVRSPDDLQVLGLINGSGIVPSGPNYRYRLSSFTVEDDHWQLDLELSPMGDTEPPQGAEALTKAARARVFNNTPLSGTKLVPGARGQLSRQLLRDACDRCRADGVFIRDFTIKLVPGRPDWLPATTKAFCYPPTQTIYLVDHDPTDAIAQRLRMLSRELTSAAHHGAIDYSQALITLQNALELTPQWWLEHLLKQHAGACLMARQHDLLTANDYGPWQPYLALLPARGLEYWSNRHAIVECMSHDFRLAFDPSGLPNPVTMLWDLVTPAIARLSQQRLVGIMGLDLP